MMAANLWHAAYMVGCKMQESIETLLLETAAFAFKSKIKPKYSKPVNRLKYR
jgi:hypothetical protein